MHLHKTTEYALRVLSFVASRGGTLTSTMHLHQELQIPYKYLSRIMTQLAEGNFLTVKKGKQGGFSMNEEQLNHNFLRLIKYFEGDDVFERCILGHENCSSSQPCFFHQTWYPVQSTLKIRFNKLIFVEFSSKEGMRF